MCRHGAYLIVWSAIVMTMICCSAVLVMAGDNTLPPDLKPMLEHAAIVAEMMHACRHTRSDLAARLSEAWSAWWTRNGRLQQALAALTNDAAGVRSEEGAPEISRSLVSPGEAGEILAAYKRLRQLLRRQIAVQAQLGNMKFVGNCDEVLA
jgi:hypothetical protein